MSKVKIPSGRIQPQEAAISPEQHHHIGKSENTYEDIGTFLSNNTDDPAIKASMAELLSSSEVDRLPQPLGFSSYAEKTHPPTA